MCSANVCASPRIAPTTPIRVRLEGEGSRTAITTVLGFGSRLVSGLSLTEPNRYQS